MAEFHEIGSSQFTDVTPTGEEKIQISASQRTTLQNIANLAPAKGVKQVVVTNFQTNIWKLSDGGNVSFPMDIKVGEIVTFTSAQDAVKGPGVGLFGYAIKYNSLMASYVGMTTSNKVNGIPTIYTYKSAGAYATAWQQLPDASVKTVEITAFTEPALSALLYSYKPGDFIPFYTNSVTASTANQFPESGIFNGFISMGSNEGDYFQIFAFKTGSPNAYIGACIGSTTRWTQIGGSDSSKGMEDLKNWTTPTYVGVNAGAGTGDYVDFLLTRALKSTDIILVTWKKQNASSKDTEIAGHAIFNPGAYSYDCCLDLLEDYQGNGDYYGLFLNQVTSEVGANMLTLYAKSEGNSYGPNYLITGVYNISGI